MPRDTLPARPYFRFSTADIAALLNTSPPSSGLRAIAIELGFRQTRGARLLAVVVERQLAAVAALADHLAKPATVEAATLPSVKEAAEMADAAMIGKGADRRAPSVTVEPATHWQPDHGVIPGKPAAPKPAKVARKVASVAHAKPAKPGKVFRWMKGGTTLRTPVGGFDWAAYDAAQAEHHALIRAKYGSLQAQVDALRKADRADMQKGGKYNESAAVKFRAQMEKARVPA